MNPLITTLGLALAPDQPSSTGGPVVSYSVAPALPAGLSLDAVTGIVSGTPLVLMPTATVVVTATNTGGSTTTSLTLTVQDQAPAALAYTTNPSSYTIDTAIQPNVPTHSGGAIASYAVSPALPEGLVLDAGTGVISGTPTALGAQATYVVTGMNGTGSTTCDFITSVVAAPIAAPATPVVTTVAYATAGKSGYHASTQDQGTADGMGYLWTLTNGSLTGGQGTPAITFTAGAVGPLTIQVKAQNLGGSANPGWHRPRVRRRPDPGGHELRLPGLVRGLRPGQRQLDPGGNHDHQAGGPHGHPAAGRARAAGRRLFAAGQRGLAALHRPVQPQDQLLDGRHPHGRQPQRSHGGPARQWQGPGHGGQWKRPLQERRLVRPHHQRRGGLVERRLQHPGSGSLPPPVGRARERPGPGGVRPGRGLVQQGGRHGRAVRSCDEPLVRRGGPLLRCLWPRRRPAARWEGLRVRRNQQRLLVRPLQRADLRPGAERLVQRGGPGQPALFAGAPSVTWKAGIGAGFFSPGGTPLDVTSSNGSFDAGGLFHAPLVAPVWCGVRAFSTRDPLQFAATMVYTAHLDADGDSEQDALDAGLVALV